MLTIINSNFVRIIEKIYLSKKFVMWSGRYLLVAVIYLKHFHHFPS